MNNTRVERINFVLMRSLLIFSFDVIHFTNSGLS